jgi:hypothetical protein
VIVSLFPETEKLKPVALAEKVNLERTLLVSVSSATYLLPSHSSSMVLCLAGALTHKARILNMALNTGNDAVVIRINFTFQRMIRTNNRFNSVFTARAHMIKVRITLTDNSFPNKKLCCDCMSHHISIVSLRFPRRGDITLITVLHDSAEQNFNVIRLNGVVVLAGVIVPEVFTKPE